MNYMDHSNSYQNNVYRPQVISPTSGPSSSFFSGHYEDALGVHEDSISAIMPPSTSSSFFHHPHQDHGSMLAASSQSATDPRSSHLFPHSSGVQHRVPSKPRDPNKAYSNPVVVPGSHERLLSEHPIRREKALLGKKGNYFCNHCDIQVRTIIELARHMDSINIIRPFHCRVEECPWHVLGFATPSEWARHTRSQHGEIAVAICDVCSKPFTRKDSLKRHCLLVHVNENSRYNKKLRAQATKRP